MISEYINDASILFKERNYSFAKSKLKNALMLDSNNIEAINLMGVVLSAENNFQEAIEYFQKGIKLNPNIFDLYSNLGKCFANIKKIEEAKKAFENAAYINDQNEEVWFNLSSIYNEQKNYSTAIDAINKVLKINPKNFLAQNFKGLIQVNLNEINSAILCFKQSITLNPKYIRSYINLGEIFKRMGDLDNSIKTYEKALLHNQASSEIYTNLAGIYVLKLQNHEEIDLNLVLIYINKSLELNSKDIVALNHLALIKIHLSEKNEAINILEKVKKINPDYFNTYINLALAYRHVGDMHNAEKEYKKAHLIQPNNSDLLFRMSAIQLASNNFHDGWTNYEKRWYAFDYKKPLKLNFTKPHWNSKLGYERVLIWAEQGVGDQLLFGTILTDVVKKFKKVFVYCDTRLKNIFLENIDNIEIIDNIEKIDESLFDYHLPFGSLGLHFRRTVNDFNKNFKFFKINKNLNYQKKTKKLKCALSWKSTNPDTFKQKSISLEDLLPILKYDSIDFYNIQYSDVGKEINNFYEKTSIKVNNIEDLDTFNDLYSLQQFIDSCDFTITISNSNAHLSAIIGKPTFLLLNSGIGKLWYWENEIDEKNIWYPSINKIKQSIEGDWEKPIKILENKLKILFNI